MLFYYLLLCNKVSPNVSVLKQTFVVLIFVWLRDIGYNLDWLLLRCRLRFQTSEDKLYRRTFVQGGLTHILIGRKLSVSQYMDFASGLLMSLHNMTAAFSDKLSKRESKLGAVFSNYSQISYAVTLPYSIH